eukprot:s862_g10.t1
MRQTRMWLAATLALCSGAQAEPMKVAVTGAGGQTGGHVFRKMLRRPELFSPVGIARTERSKEALLEATGAAPEQVVVVDLAEAAQEPQGNAGRALAAALAGCAALVIGSSAKVKPTGGTNAETGRPNMGFPDGQPYLVDWLAQKAQIDAARLAGVGHVKKLKAEKYLIDSGLTYTIVHPGGLLNEPGGKRTLVVGVDDKVPTESRSIPREDVAEVLLQSLLQSDYRDRSFDLVAEPEGSDEVCTDFASLLQSLQGSSCDYSLGAIPDQKLEAAEDALAAVPSSSLTVAISPRLHKKMKPVLQAQAPEAQATQAQAATSGSPHLQVQEAEMQADIHADVEDDAAIAAELQREEEERAGLAPGTAATRPDLLAAATAVAAAREEERRAEEVDDDESWAEEEIQRGSTTKGGLMQIKVRVPDGCGEGDTLEVVAPSGDLIHVLVPPGHGPGSLLHCTQPLRRPC